VARELGITYVLIGTPSQRRGIARLRATAGTGPDSSLIDRLLRELPGVDVRIVADPTLRRGRAAEPTPPDDPEHPEAPDALERPRSRDDD
jgi:K+-sensing histidine kinase KdpD